MAVDHGYSNFFFLLFFPALFGRPLAATIDLRVELMTKMTNPWGGRVREIMREMERDREGEQETKTNLHNMGMQSHTHKRTLYCVSTLLSVVELSVFRVEASAAEERCHIYAAQGRHFFLGSGAPSETLAWSAWR